MKQLLNLIIFVLPALLFGQSIKHLNVSKGIAIGMEAPREPLGKTLYDKPVPAIRELPQDLVILDFMNTACTSCLAALPHLQQLEQANRKVLKIISISYEKKARVEAFSKNNALFRANKLDYIVEDSVWAKYFPHQTVSHMVWVYKGKIVAITFSEFASQEMVDRVLKDGKIDLPIKDDFLPFDFDRPLLENRTGKYSFLTGYIEDAYSNYGQQVDSMNNMVREYMVNVEIIPAFLYCYGKTVELPYIKDSRIVVERPDKTRFVFTKEQSKYREMWKRTNAVSYEATFDLGVEPKSKMKAMIADLELKLGVKTALEPRSVLCWVIKDDPEAKPVVESKDGQSIADFAFMLDLNGDIPPVINETSNKRMYHNKGGAGMADVKASLKSSGFLLVEEERQIPCFILK